MIQPPLIQRYGIWPWEQKGKVSGASTIIRPCHVPSRNTQIAKHAHPSSLIRASRYQFIQSLDATECNYIQQRALTGLLIYAF